MRSTTLVMLNLLVPAKWGGYWHYRTVYRTLGPANGTTDSCSTVNAEGYPRAHVTPFILEPLAAATAS